MKIVRPGRIELPAAARDRSTRLTVRIKTTTDVGWKIKKRAKKEGNEKNKGKKGKKNWGSWKKITL